MQAPTSCNLGRRVWPAVAVACLAALPATPAAAETWNYVFSGTISSTFTSNASLPSDIAVGRPFSGFYSVLDTVSGSNGPTGTRYYSNAIQEFTFTSGSTTYTMAGVMAEHSQYYNAEFNYVAVKNNISVFGTSPEDHYEAAVGSQSQQDRVQTGFGFNLRSTNTNTFPSANLFNLVLDIEKFDALADFEYFDSRPSGGNPWDPIAEKRFAGQITSLIRQVSSGAISSGTVAVDPGTQLVIPSFSGGVIDAGVGSAQVGTLAGGTLNTGAAGATVTTLSSGTINTSGGTVATEGGTFTGAITGSGGLSMNGSGTLRLESQNTYGGGTFINSGTVEIARGDAIGSAPIRIANNGKFRAIAGVAVTNTVVAASPAATYEHVLDAGDLITNLAPVTNGLATADIVAGDSVATTVTSSFNADGSISLSGLNGTKFLMVLDLDGSIPADATPATHYLGWWNTAANDNAGGWVNAVEGNIGANGSLYAAGGYAMGYQAFLSQYGGWNGTTMLGAYGLDLANQQVWAVIDHNSDFGVTNNGILVVPEPGTLILAGLGLAGIGLRLGRRRRTPGGPDATGLHVRPTGKNQPREGAWPIRPCLGPIRHFGRLVASGFEAEQRPHFQSQSMSPALLRNFPCALVRR